MKSFLNRYVENRNAEPGKHVSQHEARLFEKACKLAVAELGKKPFHLRGRLNYGVLDSVLATLLKNPAVTDLKEKFEAYP